MSAPSQVTITLGRSGQVVKRAGPTSDANHSDDMPSSGSKRLARERLGSNMDKNKRQRKDNHGLSLGNGILNDGKQIRSNDLRLKLLNKSLARRRDVDLREKLSRKTQNLLRCDSRQHAPYSRASGPTRQIPPTRSADDLLHLDSFTKTYSSWTLDGLRHRSPDRLIGAAWGVSPQRNYDDRQHVPPVRSVNASRPVSYMNKAFSTVPVDAAKPIVRAPPPAAIIQKSPFASDERLTVSSLLHSLGLEKYVITFQAEEVDMTALRQMRDSDLKELGIPMGPRKKILLAVLAHSKQRH
ncbi:protein bicaudal C [Cocos nucifera]|uniref:Protein bicaudal C n=1 Tax=Cocos nucifera TaxID=13894 RepID=A0A8K0MUP3_COCNU|nr:protein bicaudal C [Cocos nucifera]